MLLLQGQVVPPWTGAALGISESTSLASMPVATTLTRIMPSMAVSSVEPTMMLASAIDFFADAVGRFVQFEQMSDRVPACDVDQHALGAAQADFVQQRVGDGLFGGLNGAIFALGLACAHHGFAHLVHHGAHVGKVEVDQAGTDHQVRHALNTLIKHVIRHRERLGERGFFIGQTEQVLVRNDDQRIDHLLQRLDAVFGLLHALAALELERLGDDADSQNTQVRGRLVR